MSPQDVRQLIEAIVDARLVPQWYVVGLSLFGAAAVGGLIAWLSSYFQVKAHNFANREDLDKLTEQLRQTTRAAEAIKAEISGELWVKQKRWDVKWECYSQLAEHLGEIVSALDGMAKVLKDAPEPTGDVQKDEIAKKAFGEVVDHYLDYSGPFQRRVRKAVDRIRRSSAVIRIAVAPAVGTLLSKFVEDWNRTLEGSPWHPRIALGYRVAHEAWLKVTDIARADLFGESSETATTGERQP